jgi:hypothetical protein
MGDNPTKSILNWAIGIASVAFVLLMFVIIFGNLSGNTGFADDTLNHITTNESDFTGANVFANLTGYTIAGYNSSWSAITLTQAMNRSADLATYNRTIPLANLTLSATGRLNNGTVIDGDAYENISISYTYTHSFQSSEERDAENIITNYTSGAVNTSAQFPTVGTILGVALLILILLALLVFVIVKMSGVSFGGGSSKGDFTGGDFG